MTQTTRCLDDETLYKFVDHQVRGTALKRIEHHLDECSHCRQQLTEILNLVYSPITDDEKKTLKSIERIPIETRLQELFNQHIKLTSAQQEAPQTRKESRTTVQKIQSLIEKRRPTRGYRPRVAFIFMVIISAGFAVRYYQTVYPLVLAEKTMHETHILAASDGRLSGDYRGKWDGQLMAGDDTNSDLKKAQRRVMHALHKKNSVRGRRLLAQTYILNDELSRADSILQTIDTKDAQVLNDIGLIYVKQGNWRHAEDYFLRALQDQPENTPTLYNLALLYLELDQQEKAVALLQQCIQYETDASWLKIVRAALKDIRDDL